MLRGWRQDVPAHVYHRTSECCAERHFSRFRYTVHPLQSPDDDSTDDLAAPEGNRFDTLRVTFINKHSRLVTSYVPERRFRLQYRMAQKVALGTACPHRLQNKASLKNAIKSGTRSACGLQSL